MGFNTLIAVMLSLLIVGCKVPVGPSPKAATHGDVKTTLLVLLKDLAMFVSFSCQAFLDGLSSNLYLSSGNLFRSLSTMG